MLTSCHAPLASSTACAAWTGPAGRRRRHTSRCPRRRRSRPHPRYSRRSARSRHSETSCPSPLPVPALELVGSKLGVDAVQVLPAGGHFRQEAASGATSSPRLPAAPFFRVTVSSPVALSSPSLTVKRTVYSPSTGAGDGRGGLVGAAQDNLGALRAENKLPCVAHASFAVGHAVVGRSPSGWYRGWSWRCLPRA